VIEQEMGTVEGISAIRAFFEEWLGFFEETQFESEEVLDLGNGVWFAVIRMDGRPVGSSGQVQMRFASVSARTEGLVVWIRHYTETDIEKARAAAERLSQERAQADVEESTTPDLEEAVRQAFEALNRRDFDAALSLYAPDVIWEMRPLGSGVLEGGSLIGHEAMRKFWKDVTDAFADFELEREDFRDLGSGVMFEVLVLRGRPHGSDGFVEARGGVVAIWSDGRIARGRTYLDIDEARAAAERLAQERG
jgi:ketosteroid isomerase-like protein